MKEIGGYFSLELTNRYNFPQALGALLNSGRNALEYILRNVRDVKKLHIPYFTCDVVLEPLHKLHIPYEFYSINEQLELANEITLSEDEYLLYTNYFGIKDKYIRALASIYADHLIVDNAQALYAQSVEGTNTLYSPRKFVGIPDGGVAYCSSATQPLYAEKDKSFERCSHLLKRLDIGAGAGYADFKANSYQLVEQPIRQMSELTKSLINAIDFDYVRSKRMENFSHLHSALASTNRLNIPATSHFACPMIYPYLCKKGAMLKKLLIENKIFVATYWPNVLEWTEPTTLEHQLTTNLLAIPIDQRYEEEDMKRIINMITHGSNSIV